MIRKMVCALFVMTVAIGFVVAETRTGIISNIKDNTFDFQPTKKGQPDGDKLKLTLGKDATVAKGIPNKDTKKTDKGEALPGGLTNEVFKGDKGTNASVTYEGTTASEVLVVGKKKKAAE